MTYEVVISETATHTFEYIRTQVEDKWGEKYVKKFETRVGHILDIVTSSPFAYKSIPFNSNIRKAFIHKNCSMFYEIDESKVTILFFWDNRQAPIFL